MAAGMPTVSPMSAGVPTVPPVATGLPTGFLPPVKVAELPTVSLPPVEVRGMNGLWFTIEQDGTASVASAKFSSDQQSSNECSESMFAAPDKQSAFFPNEVEESSSTLNISHVEILKQFSNRNVEVRNDQVHNMNDVHGEDGTPAMNPFYEQVNEIIQQVAKDTQGAAQSAANKLAVLLAEVRRLNATELQARAKSLHAQYNAPECMDGMFSQMTPVQSVQPPLAWPLNFPPGHLDPPAVQFAPGQWQLPDGCAPLPRLQSRNTPDAIGGCAFMQMVRDILIGWNSGNTQLVAKCLVSMACSLKCCIKDLHTGMIIRGGLLSKTPQDGSLEAAESRAELFLAICMEFHKASTEQEPCKFRNILQRICRSLLMEKLAELNAKQNARDDFFAHIKLLGYLFQKGLMSKKALSGVMQDLLRLGPLNATLEYLEATGLLLRMSGA